MNTTKTTSHSAFDAMWCVYCIGRTSINVYFNEHIIRDIDFCMAFQCLVMNWFMKVWTLLLAFIFYFFSFELTHSRIIRRWNECECVNQIHRAITLNSFLGFIIMKRANGWDSWFEQMQKAGDAHNTIFIHIYVRDEFLFQYPYPYLYYYTSARHSHHLQFNEQQNVCASASHITSSGILCRI